MIRPLDLSLDVDHDVLHAFLESDPDRYVLERIHLEVFPPNTKLMSFWGVFEAEVFQGFIFFASMRSTVTYGARSASVRHEIEAFLATFLEERKNLVLFETTLDHSPFSNETLLIAKAQLKRTKIGIYYKLPPDHWPPRLDEEILKSEAATEDNIEELSELLKPSQTEDAYFPHGEAFLKLMLKIGRISFIRDSGQIVSMTGTSLESESVALLDFFYTSKTIRGKGYGQDSSTHLNKSVIKDGKTVYCYAERDGVKRLVHYLGYQPIGQVMLRYLSHA